MTPAEDLFELIKSLTKNEKRFFRLSITLQKGEKNHLRLFDVISKQKEYDEKAIKKHFAHNKKFIASFSSWKKYLYRSLLKSLRNYYTDHSVNVRLLHIMNDIETLFQKGLFKQCEKLMDKAKNIAHSHDKYLPFLLLNDYENAILTRQNYPKKMNSHFKERTKNINAMLEKYKNEFEYGQLSQQIYSLFKKHGYAREKKGLKKYEYLITNPLLQDDNKAITFRSKNNFYGIHALYSSLKGDWEATYKYRIKALELAESRAEIIKGNPRMYINILGNLLVVCDVLKKNDVFKQILQKMRNFPATSIELQHFIFQRSYTLEFEHYLSNNEFAEGVKLIPAIKEYIEKNNKVIVNVLAHQFYYNMAYSNFGVGNFSDTLKLLNKILSDSDKELREDIYCYVRMLALIVHYELGNEEFLEYDIKSFNRYLDKNHRFYAFESLMINFFHKIIKFHSNERQTSFKKLQSELYTFSKKSFMTQVFESFDFISWAKSKIENKSFAEIVRGKAKQTLISEQ